MQRFLTPAGFAVALGLGACFIESPKPSTFRFACEVDDDCEEPQTCSEGLCQQVCGGSEDLACPDSAPLCFNGHCSSVCPVADDVCPLPQTCMTFADPSSEEPPTSGVCAISCDEDHPCTDGQLCLEGICLTACASDDECGQGETCVANLCIPGG